MYIDALMGKDNLSRRVKARVPVGGTTFVLICTEESPNRARYLHCALTRPCRERLF